MSDLYNYRQTLKELHAFLAIPVVNERDRAGVIKSFEMTFEQAWKAIQKVAGQQGLQAASPKHAFSVALQSGWTDVNDEGKWLQMIKDRNLAVHTYREALAKDLLERIQKHYVTLFDQLIEALEIQTKATPSKA